MEFIAHRGLSRRFPENTLPAFLAAVDCQADRLEFDVCLTRDGEFVVIHDDTLDRTTNHEGFVAHRSVRELKQLDAGGWFKPKFSPTDDNPQGCRIPTLEQTLNLLAGKIPLNIEIKPFFPVDRAQLLQSALLNMLKTLKKHDWLDATLISSSNIFILEYIRDLNDDVKLGLIYQPPVTDYNPVYVAERLNAYSLHPHYRAASAELVAKMHERDVKVYAYTVNSRKRFAKMLAAGVDGVFTDVPDKLRLLMDQEE